MATLLLAGLLSLLIGGTLGLLGGGGGILAVPMLVYVVGVAAKPAIAASLFLVGMTSLVGTAVQARAGRVRWKLGATFGAGSMAGAFAGGRLAQWVPERVLLLGLAGVMLVTALALLRGRVRAGEADRSLSLARVLSIGAAVGLLSGLVGAGGGFLIVPALTLFGGVAIHEAIATSLFIITLQSFAGFTGHVSHVSLDWQLLSAMTGSAVIGMLSGSALGERVSPHRLKQAFAALIFVTGLFVLARQLPLVATTLVSVAALGTAFVFLRQKPATATPKEKHRCISSTHLQA